MKPRETAEFILGKHRTGKSLDIATAIVARYPCGEFPTGTLTDLGKEFDVTRERVRQIAQQLGWIRVNKPVLPRVCKYCGTGLSPDERGSCYECSWPQISCSICEKIFRRRRSQVIARRKEGVELAEHFFCSVECREKGKIKYDWIVGKRTNRQNKHPLGRLIRDLDMTYEEFSEETGFSKAALSVWLKGKTDLNPESVERLERWLQKQGLERIEDVGLSPAYPQLRKEQPSAPSTTNEEGLTEIQEYEPDSEEKTTKREFTSLLDRLTDGSAIRR